MDHKLKEKLTRCPRLGHEITFSYCLKESLDLPCARIMHCWSSIPHIEAVLQEELPPAVWHKFINLQPKDKVASIIDLIEAVKIRK